MSSDPKPPFEWTIMVYLSGDNNLSEQMVRALQEIQALEGDALPPATAVTIQYDPWAPGFRTSRYAIPRQAPAEKLDHDQLVGLLPIQSFLVETLDQEDASDPRTLAGFIGWSAQLCPSRYRMLILSGHGNGVAGDFLSDDNARPDRPGSFTIPGLKRALGLAAKGDAEKKIAALPVQLGRDEPLLHVLGMDSCLMGMAEVCQEVAGQAQYVVGSEGFVPNAGWPYAHLLRCLLRRVEKQGRGLEPCEVAQAVVEDVIGHYQDYLAAGLSLDITACHTPAVAGVAEALRGLKERLAGGEKLPVLLRDPVIVAHWRAQSYKFEQHTDLWDFSNELRQAVGSVRGLADEEVAAIVATCERVKTAINAAVVASDYCGAEFQHSHGLSVYFPWTASPYETSLLRDYEKLGFAQASGWAAFLAAYLRDTQRAAAGEGDQPLVQRFVRPSPGYPPGRAAEGTNRAAEGTNRAAEGTNRLVMNLYAASGMTPPGSMKNPPRGVRPTASHVAAARAAAAGRTATTLAAGQAPTPAPRAERT
jgi:hypothetical protein